METPFQRCARLIAALEDLVTQESATLQAGQFLEAIAIQKRSAPLVESLAASTPDIPDTLRPRINALLDRRQLSDAWLAREIEATRIKLDEAAKTQRRVARIAPAYGNPDVPSRRLRAIG